MKVKLENTNKNHDKANFIVWLIAWCKFIRGDLDDAWQNPPATCCLPKIRNKDRVELINFFTGQAVTKKWSERACGPFYGIDKILFNPDRELSTQELLVKFVSQIKLLIVATQFAHWWHLSDDVLRVFTDLYRIKVLYYAYSVWQTVISYGNRPMVSRPTFSTEVWPGVSTLTRATSSRSPLSVIIGGSGGQKTKICL